MHLFQRGTFVLASGAKSGWKLECDSLTGEDWEALAFMAWQVAGPFDGVHGVPRGGVVFADHLRQYNRRVPGGEGGTPGMADPGKALPMLIVDDVLTTGGSLRRFAAEKQKESGLAYPIIRGVVVFARGDCPAWVTPLFQMPPVLWLPKAPG
jgi:orotate phosphoribosyltransferase